LLEKPEDIPDLPESEYALILGECIRRNPSTLVWPKDGRNVGNRHITA
jgi:hypothetical protein